MTRPDRVRYRVSVNLPTERPKHRQNAEKPRRVPSRDVSSVATRNRRLALVGVAGQSVGVLAGAAGWRFSGEPAWLVMAGVSFALALVLLRRV